MRYLRKQSDGYWSSTSLGNAFNVGYNSGNDVSPTWLNSSPNSPASGRKPGDASRPDMWQLKDRMKDPESGYMVNVIHPRRIHKNKQPQRPPSERIKNKRRKDLIRYMLDENIDPMSFGFRNPMDYHSDTYSDNPYSSSNFAGIESVNSKKLDDNIFEDIVDTRKIRRIKRMMDTKNELESIRNKHKYQKQPSDTGTDVSMGYSLSGFNSGSYEENMNYSGIDHTCSIDNNFMDYIKTPLKTIIIIDIILSNIKNKLNSDEDINNDVTRLTNLYNDIQLYDDIDILKELQYINLLENICNISSIDDEQKRKQYLSKIINGKNLFLIKEAHVLAPSVNPNSGPDNVPNKLKVDYKWEEKEQYDVNKLLRKMIPLYQKYKGRSNRTIDPERKYEKYSVVMNEAPTTQDRQLSDYTPKGTNYWPSSQGQPWTDDWS